MICIDVYEAPMALPKAQSPQSSATIGFEAKLWLTADKLRNNMDAAEYKHVVLGLIFLKYISDTFEEHRAKLLAGKGDIVGDIYLVPNNTAVISGASFGRLVDGDTNCVLPSRTARMPGRSQ